MAPIFDRLRRRRADMPFCTAVVPAAGSSTRMEGQDKILLTLGDYPVLVRTLPVSYTHLTLPTTPYV